MSRTVAAITGRREFPLHDRLRPLVFHIFRSLAEPTTSSSVCGDMKTIIDLPDAVFLKAKNLAMKQEITPMGRRSDPS